MDDARIKDLTEEVFRQLRGPAPAGELEQRVAALEKAVRELRAGSPPRGAVASAGTSRGSAALAVLSTLGSVEGEGCVLEPGKPCTSSGRCRSFGH